MSNWAIVFQGIVAIVAIGGFGLSFWNYIEGRRLRRPFFWPRVQRVDGDNAFNIAVTLENPGSFPIVVHDVKLKNSKGTEIDCAVYGQAWELDDAVEFGLSKQIRVFVPPEKNYQVFFRYLDEPVGCVVHVTWNYCNDPWWRRQRKAYLTMTKPNLDSMRLSSQEFD